MKSTESYYRLVIDLYREVISGKHQVNLLDRISEARRQLAMAVTTAHVLNTPDRELVALSSDLDHLEECL